MNANGYGNYGGCLASSAKAAIWNVYCDSTMEDCVVARQPTPSHANPVLKDQVDWDTAWNEMERLATQEDWDTNWNEMEETQQQQTETFTVTVDAKKNCIKAGGASGPASVTDGTPLYTDIYLRALERLTITQIDPTAKWSGGPGEEHSGNADGTSAFGDYALDWVGPSFPYGSLVGQIGDSDYFLVGTRYNSDVKQNGVLKLMYWDSNNLDNSGSLKFSIRIVPFEPKDDDVGNEVSSGTHW
jgi:hypothetical protein